MRRFFYDASQADFPSLSRISINSEFVLPERIVHHWCQVLRGKIGQLAVLFDGLGGEYQVQLSHVHKKTAKAVMLGFTDVARASNITSCIGLVMSRGDRMDYAIQKATELGVTAIQLLTSHRGEVRLKPAQISKKLNHWQQVAIAACEQCGLNHPPVILAPVSMLSWVSQTSSTSQTTANNILELTENGQMCDYMQPIVMQPYYQALQSKADISLILCVPQTGQTCLSAEHIQSVLLQKDPYIRLLIGAEGGFDDEEISQALAQGWQPWQIGERVLRTETAPVVALSTLQAWQRL